MAYYHFGIILRLENTPQNCLFIAKKPLPASFILNLKSLRPKAEEMYLKYKKNPENLKKDFYAIQAKMFSSFRILIKNQWYTNLYSNFVKNSQNFSNFSVFAFEGLEALLLRIIRSKINEEKSNALLFPLYSSFASRQNMDLINIIRSLPPAEISLLKKELSDLKCYPVFKDLLKKHRTNWGWAFTNYGSEAFPALKNLLNLAIEIHKNMGNELRQAEEAKNKRINKEKLLKTIKAEEKNLISFLDIVMELRDQRKAAFLQTIVPLKKYLNAIAKKSKFSL